MQNKQRKIFVGNTTKGQQQAIHNFYCWSFCGLRIAVPVHSLHSFLFWFFSLILSIFVVNLFVVVICVWNSNQQTRVLFRFKCAFGLSYTHSWLMNDLCLPLQGFLRRILCNLQILAHISICVCGGGGSVRVCVCVSMVSHSNKQKNLMAF